ncbi:Aminomethyltransferase, mitochondrial [Pseudolycoriella hygida]|uniref:Aminomethyltransferase n=1 Tax=Pseudolycoriella hygida TaxID=35572 RepID=A0A9Q0N326_9DIPT|nr:Aminomethyltransferase, mitochondrial [Pseudolycoriella hygida]
MITSRILPRTTRSLFTKSVRALSANATTTAPEKTSLYDFHVANNGKMVDFAGYLLPVQYANLSITASHLHTRKHASIFDVSHMLQTYIHGKDAINCFEQLCTADIHGLPENVGTLTVFTNATGGILDDLIVTKVRSDLLYVVSNAAMKVSDKALIQNAVDQYQKSKKDVSVEFLDPSDRALIAVQGPEAMKAVQGLTKRPLDKFYFMQTMTADIAGVSDCRVTRCGYTGEDGCEISISADRASHVVENLLGSKLGHVELAGLGARDSLRLEAGLCLYGSDIGETTKPVESGLAWLVAKRRREEGNFPGATAVLDQLKNGCKQRRVGIKMANGPPARHGAEIFKDGKVIGTVTSGCPSPSIGGNVAMGYVLDEFKGVGQKVDVNIRNKMYGAEIAKMPFIKTNYFTDKK